MVFRMGTEMGAKRVDFSKDNLEIIHPLIIGKKFPPFQSVITETPSGYMSWIRAAAN